MKKRKKEEEKERPKNVRGIITKHKSQPQNPSRDASKYFSSPSFFVLIFLKNDILTFLLVHTTIDNGNYSRRETRQLKKVSL